MATERSSITRVLMAVRGSARPFLLAPGFALFVFMWFAPHNGHSRAVTNLINFGGMVLFITGSILVLTQLFLAYSAGRTEYRYGSAMRRTGLTENQLRAVIRLLPYTEWYGHTKRMMLLAWSAEEFLQYYKEAKLQEARKRQGAVSPYCTAQAINTRHVGEGFDEQAFIARSWQTYRTEFQRLKELTTIPDD